MSTNFTVSVPNWLDIIIAWPVMFYRWFKYGYTYRRIDLGEGIWTKLDLPDYYRLGRFKWFVSGQRGKFYAVRSRKASKVKFNPLPLHREIMNARKRRIVDHENGDSLDNRKANLRFATRAQNTYNRRKTKRKTSSRFIGVSFEKRYRRWVVSIIHKGKTHWIGRFKNEIEAARAYDKAAKKYRGKFARLNFPEKKQNKCKNTGILSYLKIPFVTLGLRG